jgi:hypothetical protein
MSLYIILGFRMDTKQIIENVTPLGRHFPSAAKAGCAKEPIRVAITGAAG